MEKKEILRNFIAGTFFLACCVLTVFMILTIGKDKGLTQPKFKITVLFSKVGGLLEGAPVLLSGVHVGTVADISFLDQEIEQRRVNVDLNIFSKFKKQFNKSARFSIKTEGILGEKLVKIDVVEDPRAFNFGQSVLGEDPLDVQDVAETFTKAAESFTKTAEEISQIDLVELTDVMEESSRALLLTSEGFNSIMGELEEIAQKSKRLMDRLEQKIIDDDLFKVF